MLKNREFHRIIDSQILSDIDETLKKHEKKGKSTKSY